jgi:hypothetical protein
MRRALLLFLIATPLFARVDHVDVIRTDLGPNFEKIVGKVYFAVDPKNPHNTIVADLDKAPRNAAGEVEFSADLYVIRPKLRRNDTLFVEISIAATSRAGANPPARRFAIDSSSIAATPWHGSDGNSMSDRSRIASACTRRSLRASPEKCDPISSFRKKSTSIRSVM